MNFEVKSSRRTVKVHFPKPTFTDNVGIKEIVASRINGSMFTWGEHIIIFIAYDKAGNNASCSLKIKVIGKY